MKKSEGLKDKLITPFVDEDEKVVGKKRYKEH